MDEVGWWEDEIEAKTHPWLWIKRRKWVGLFSGIRMETEFLNPWTY